jgi:S1-C subfamily serine protease
MDTVLELPDNAGDWGPYTHPWVSDPGGAPPAPYWLAPRPPAPDAGPSRAGGPPAPSRNGSLRLAALTALVGLGIGAVVGTMVHRHGSRPILNASNAVPLAPSAQAPGTGNDPVSPSPPSTAPPLSTDGSSGSRQLPGGTPTIGAIAAAVDPSIVDINTVLDFGIGSGAGTGMILTPNGEILTNNHVINGATTISVTIATTGKRFTATVVGTDPSQDVAVLQLQGASGLTPIPIGDSGAVSAGDLVVALGNAGGVGGTPAAVSGTVRATSQTITASDPGGANAETLTGLIETDAPIQPGDSGGPLVNGSGRVIGMDTAASSGRRFQTAASVGFAIPIAHALSIAQQIETGRASATVHLGLPAFIGVAIAPAGSPLSGSAAGAVVGGVQSGSPAARAGLKSGDTVTSIGGQPVSSAAGLSTLIKSHHPGDKVAVGWSDQSGGTHTATVTLASGPAD